ncbi:unnamed protein product [Rhizophagus irregularis]|nr:unnamed protein product [Rhizophagus irregularis]
MDIVTTATLQYKQSNQSNTEVGLLTLEEMSKQLFERILEINTNEYLENDLTSRAMFQKFIRPCLDLVIYILLTRLIPHHQNKYLCGWEKLSW